MKEKLTQLLQEGKDRIAAVRSEAELQEVKALLLGKQGSLTGLLKELPKLDAALRPEMGKAVNQAKAQLTALLDQRREELKLKASEVSPDFDISVPGILPPLACTPSPRCATPSTTPSAPWASRSLRSPTLPVSCTASTI
mgnify:CR=1 FL=1